MSDFFGCTNASAYMGSEFPVSCLMDLSLVRQPTYSLPSSIMSLTSSSSAVIHSAYSLFRSSLKWMMSSGFFSIISAFFSLKVNYREVLSLASSSSLA